MPSRKPKGDRPMLRGLERVVHRHIDAIRETPIKVTRDVLIQALRDLAEPPAADASADAIARREVARSMALRAVADALEGADTKWQLKLSRRGRGRPSASFAAESERLDRDAGIYVELLALRMGGMSRADAIEDLADTHKLSAESIERIVEDIGHTPPERTISFPPD